MMRLVFLLASVTSAMAAGTDNGGGFAGSFSSGNGQGYGYGGSFGSDGSAPQGIPFNFNSAFSQYFDVFNRFNQGLASNKLSAYAYSITKVGANSKAQAHTSLTFSGKGLQNQQNMFGPGGFGFPSGHAPFFGGGGGGYGGSGYGGSGGGGYGGSSSGGGGYGGSSSGSGGYGGSFSNFGGSGSSGAYPGGQSTFSGGYGGGFSNFGNQGASASGFIGPGGSHQTAAVYPSNPNIPNVNTRFGESSGGGNYGVFTSSQSLSSNVDGKPVNYHKASTTINDNGKVSTYTVHNP